MFKQTEKYALIITQARVIQLSVKQKVCVCVCVCVCVLGGWGGGGGRKKEKRDRGDLLFERCNPFFLFNPYCRISTGLTVISYINGKQPKPKPLWCIPCKPEPYPQHKFTEISRMGSKSFLNLHYMHATPFLSLYTSCTLKELYVA